MGWGDGGEGVKWVELASVEAEKLCRRRVVVATRQSSSDAVLPSSLHRGARMLKLSPEVGVVSAPPKAGVRIAAVKQRWGRCNWTPSQGRPLLTNLIVPGVYQRCDKAKTSRNWSVWFYNLNDKFLSSCHHY